MPQACEEAGIRFVGPSAATLRLCGDKLETRAAAERAGVPVLAASPPLGDDPDSWIAAAERIGYPLLVKPAGAGGGRGLRHVADASTLLDAVSASLRESATSGAGAVVYLEREMVEARHVEVQIVADGRHAIALGDRDCSLQRRHQKVIEEAPAPNVDDATRRDLHASARDLAVEVGLRGIATCEFLLAADGEIAFLEINPRIQVEHPVTEMVTGVDLVEWQLRIAAGEDLPEAPWPEPRGHAVEARVYAEDPWAGFRPAPGKLASVSWPVRPNIRVDAGFATNDIVPHAYDPMLAKVIAFGVDRSAAIEELRGALLDTVVAGVATNIGWLVNLLDNEAFLAGRATTNTANTVTPVEHSRASVAIAALAHLLDGSASPQPDAWSTIGPWRMSGCSPVTLHGDDWDERFDVWRSSAGWQVRRQGSDDAIRWWQDSGGVWTINDGDEVARMAVVERGPQLEVFGPGGWWTVSLGPRPTNGAAQRDRPGSGRIIAPMPASVVEVHVEGGDRVGPGQLLVTLTAMKMEIMCEAPVAGIVESIGCQAGDLVAADQVLVNLRVDGPGTGLE